MEFGCMKKFAINFDLISKILIFFVEEFLKFYQTFKVFCFDLRFEKF